MLIAVVLKGDAGVELPRAGAPAAGDNVIQINHGRMRCLIGQREVIVTARVPPADRDQPVLGAIVVMKRGGAGLGSGRRNGGGGGGPQASPNASTATKASVAV